jgi:hypothetical protein
MRRLLLTLLTVLCAPLLRAQAVEIYGTAGDLHVNNVAVLPLFCPTGVTPCTQPFTSSNNLSVGGGVTLRLIGLGLLSLGVDGRGSHHTGTYGSDTGLAGLKLTIKPPFFRARPYLQGSAGYLGTYTNGSSNHYFATEILAGVDLPILPILDLRAIEVGGGHALTSSANTKPTFYTIGAGLVLHF